MLENKRGASLRHINRPDPCSGPKIKYSYILGALYCGAVKLLSPSDEEECVEEVHPILFGLGSR